LDDAACRELTRKAKFKPALNDAGNPVASVYANTFTWTIK